LISLLARSVSGDFRGMAAAGQERANVQDKTDDEGECCAQLVRADGMVGWWRRWGESPKVGV
jgi:hypothetical protein